MLADGVCNALRFDLTGAAIWPEFILGRAFVYVVNPGMGNFMYKGFNILQFTHTLVNSNALVNMAKVPFCTADGLLKVNGKRARIFPRRRKSLCTYLRSR